MVIVPDMDDTVDPDITIDSLATTVVDLSFEHMDIDKLVSEVALMYGLNPKGVTSLEVVDDEMVKLNDSLY